MKLSDFDFDLPEGLIATRPARPRTSARLLLAEGDADQRPACVRPGRHLPPRRPAGPEQHQGDPRAPVRHRASAARRWRRSRSRCWSRAPQGWRALAKPLRKVQAGEVIRFSDRLSATVAEKAETDLTLAFNLTGEDFDAALAEAGVMPLPPYIAAKRAADDAGPRPITRPSLPAMPGPWPRPPPRCISTSRCCSALAAKGVRLHRGDAACRRGHLPAGQGRGCDHPPDACRMGRGDRRGGGRDQRDQAGRGADHPGRHHGAAADRKRGRRATASCTPGGAETDIFIYPGYRFRVTDALMTNFHLPKSTLMMLVSALMGETRIRRDLCPCHRAGLSLLFLRRRLAPDP